MQKHLIGIGLFTLRTITVTAMGAALLAVLFFGFNNPIITAILPELITLVISVSLIAVTTHQVVMYQTEMACMSGMMVGMTTGMLSGFLIGYLVGATNGMFVGSLVGVLTGSAIGVVTGRCCGIMGVMEGLMAALMAGTMGAMLSVMMITDNYRAFTIVFVAFCAVLFGALSVMVDREFVAMGKPTALAIIRKHESLVQLSTVIATVLIMLVMVYAPRGPLTILTGLV